MRRERIWVVNVREARQVLRNAVAEKRKEMRKEMDPKDRERHESRYAAKLPFTEGMLERSRNANFVNPSATTIDKMAYVANALALHLDNRPGEVSSNGPLEVDEGRDKR